MKAMAYLLGATLKNAVKELRKNPGRLIFLLLMAALMIFVFVSGGQASPPEGGLRNPRELEAILFAFYLFMAVTFALQGLSSGATFYSMADVNLLFQMPVSPRRVLLYGMIRQMGTSLLIGFFLLFQYTTLHVWYGVGIGGLLLILLTYGVTIFCSQLTAMAIYALTSNSERARKGVKIGIFLLCGGLAAWVAVPAFLSDAPLSAAVDAASAPWLSLFPIAGWMKAAAAAGFGANPWGLLLGFGLALGYCLLFVLLITKARADFYEDVLRATEVSFNALTAKKEGKTDMVPAQVKVGKTGLGGGSGANAFYYKQRLEERRAKIFLLDGMGLLMAGMTILFSFFMRENGILPIFAFATYLQIFSTMTGRWIRELTLPYVYLLPEKSARKLWMLCRQNLRKIALDALIVMIPAGLIVGASPLEIAMAVLARAGFGLLFMAGTILNERILGGLTNRVLIMTFYFLVMLLLATPGIVLGVLAGILINGLIPWAAIALGLLTSFVWNLLAASLIIFLCRDLLDCAELSGK